MSDFILLPPIAITGAMVTACNVPETPPAAYAAGTTYALAATCSTGTAGGALTVYESLQAANTGNTPASSPTWWKAIGTTYAEHDAGTTYALGAIIIVVADHKEYESLQAGNLNKTPATEPTWWLERGSTNRHKAFDQKVGSRTERADLITYTLLPGQLFDSITFLDVVGQEIAVVITDPTEGVVLTETIDLIAKGRVVDSYTYYFEPIILRNAAALFGVPPYSQASISITITYTGGTAGAGTIAVGNKLVFGTTQQKAEVEIIDYSRKTKDQFGVYSITVREYSKRITLQVLVANTMFDEMVEILGQYRSTPGIWIGSHEYSSLMAYGIYINARPVMEYPLDSLLAITIDSYV